MRKFTIMGFTEAELGFVLAAVFIVVAVGAIHDRDAAAASVRDGMVVVAERDSLRVLHDSLTAEIARIRTTESRVGLLRDSIAALEAKISTKVPQCWEKGESSAPVANVDVLAADRFRLNGEALTIGQVRERLAHFIARGDSLGCRYIVRARPVAGVDARVQADAVWRLRRWFDVNDRP